MISKPLSWILGLLACGVLMVPASMITYRLDYESLFYPIPLFFAGYFYGKICDGIDAITKQ